MYYVHSNALNQWDVTGEGRYLHFNLDVLSCRYLLVQCLLCVLHVAAVKTVDQQPGEGHKSKTAVNLNTPLI